MALSADRNLDHTETAWRETGTVASGKTIYKGAIIETDVSGKIIPAYDDATVGTCMGIAEAGATAAQTVAYLYNCLFWLPIHGTDITEADVGDNAYAYDDESVTTTTSLGPVVGQIRKFKTGYALVWVGGSATPHSTT